MFSALVGDRKGICKIMELRTFLLSFSRIRSPVLMCEKGMVTGWCQRGREMFGLSRELGRSGAEQMNKWRLIVQGETATGLPGFTCKGVVVKQVCVYMTCLLACSSPSSSRMTFVLLGVLLMWT